MTSNNPVISQKNPKQLELTFFAFEEDKKHLSKTLREGERQRTPKQNSH
jgi:hypothetical protein